MSMIEKTEYTAPIALIKQAISDYSLDQYKTSLNRPTGNFFYDPWVIKDEYIGTVWEKILSTLPVEYGETRIIILKNGCNYQSHADIDDRYHLNLQGNHSFLIDIDNQQMFNTALDGVWYSMRTDCLHTAANFGEIDRVQLVVRKLLKKNQLTDPVHIELRCVDEYLARYHFDNTVSPWLNKNNKLGTIADFSYKNNTVQLKIEKWLINELTKILPKQFNLIKI